MTTNTVTLQTAHIVSLEILKKRKQASNHLLDEHHSLNLCI